MPNLQQKISQHNRKTINKEKKENNNNNNNNSNCNCRIKENCPLQNQCLKDNIIYQATVTSVENTINENNTKETYVGVLQNGHLYSNVHYNIHEENEECYVWIVVVEGNSK